MDCSDSQGTTLDPLEDTMIASIPEKTDDDRIHEALNDWERVRVWLDLIRC